MLRALNFMGLHQPAGRKSDRTLSQPQPLALLGIEALFGIAISVRQADISFPGAIAG